MNRKVWVESKSNKKPEIVLDVSDRMINSWSRLMENWEMFVDITGSLPDVILMTQRQYDWYANELIAFADLMGLNADEKIKVNFRGLPIRIK